MTGEHPNATAYRRRTADAFRSGDIVGRDALVNWLRRVTALGFWLTEHDVFGNDEHVCALSIMGARRPGVEVETRVVSIFHYRDGQQLARWFYPEDASAWATIYTDAPPDRAAGG